MPHMHAWRRSLKCSYSRVMHTILGAGIVQKIFKLAVLLLSSDAKMCTHLTAIKYVRQLRLFLEHIRLSYGSPTLLY